ncbi:MAG TPA: esterase [Rheinheimera sp.]|nr:esterase [Rheinheimera sp.]
MKPNVIYLHGFASSSQSDKAVLVRNFFETELPHLQLHVPDIPYTPVEAWAELNALCEEHRPTALIGSSLGGFLATCLAERYQVKAALINPAVNPHLLLAKHLGRYFHPVRQQHYDVSAEQMPFLADLVPAKLAEPSQYLVLLQTGDEVLDYRHAVEFYAGSQLDVQEGGDHAYQNLQSRLRDIVNFCQLA